MLEAENRRIALDRVAESRPGVILLDLMMPEMDGFQFVEELRKRPEWNDSGGGGVNTGFGKLSDDHVPVPNYDSWK